jgi:hypothetical protein
VAGVALKGGQLYGFDVSNSPNNLTLVSKLSNNKDFKSFMDANFGEGGLDALEDSIFLNAVDQIDINNPEAVKNNEAALLALDPHWQQRYGS